MPAPNPDHLLDQADALIDAAGGPGAPRQTDLRRAISAAYYALFHALAAQAADTLIGAPNKQTPLYALVYRSLQHRSVREFCDQVQRTPLPPKIRDHAPKAGFGLDLKAMAHAVVELQEKRHLADYDPGFRATASDATFAVATARAALAGFRRSNASTRKAFVCLAVFSPR